MPTLKQAKWTYLLNIPMLIIYTGVLVLMGNVVYAYFAYKRCDPYEVSPDRVLDRDRPTKETCKIRKGFRLVMGEISNFRC